MQRPRGQQFTFTSINAFSYGPRAPELLYGSRTYSQAVDLWSVGCIFGEMINRSPIFPGENDIDQLGIVVKALGTPNEDVWPGVAGSVY